MGDARINEILAEAKECKEVLTNLSKSEYNYRYYEGKLAGLKSALEILGFTLEKET